MLSIKEHTDLPVTLQPQCVCVCVCVCVYVCASKGINSDLLIMLCPQFSLTYISVGD